MLEHEFIQTNMFETDKERIVQAILPQVPESEIATVEWAMKTWWKNIRRSGGLGLTHYGDGIFRGCGLEYWDFDCGAASHLSVMGLSVTLDRRMPAPYYFYCDKKRRRVRVYDGRMATLAVLYGDFTEYLNTLEEKKYD